MVSLPFHKSLTINCVKLSHKNKFMPLLSLVYLSTGYFFLALRVLIMTPGHHENWQKVTRKVHISHPDNFYPYIYIHEPCTVLLPWTLQRSISMNPVDINIYEPLQRSMSMNPAHICILKPCRYLCSWTQQRSTLINPPEICVHKLHRELRPSTL